MPAFGEVADGEEEMAKNASKAQSVKSRQQPVRQDLIRGLRWGLAMLFAGLLGLAVMRTIDSTPAVADEPPPANGDLVVAEPQAQDVIAEEQPVEELALEVGVPTGTAKAPAPVASKPRRKASSKPKPAPKTFQANQFVAPVRANSAASAVNVPLEPVDTGQLPSVPLASAPEPLASPQFAPTLAPPPETDPTIKDRARGIVRSVGRVFGIGRRNEAKSSGDGGK